jgi:hypothetical protein
MSCNRTLLAGALLACLAPGCANLMTSRAIDAFAESVAESRTEDLREVTSERFAQQALRLPEAGDDLKVLNLPHGKLTVLKVEDVSSNLKHVTVQVGDSGERNDTIEYHLIREPGQRRWVVDDVFITRNKTGRGEPVTKSVTEQMNLLLTVREFVAAWSKGTRDDALDVAAPGLQEALAPLPPSYLQQLTAEMVDGVNTRSLRPEARIDGERAVVMVSRTGGKLMISLNLDGDRWRVTDVAAESRDGSPVASVRVMAGALQAASRFLSAYAAADHSALEAASTPSLYKNSLVAADLADVPLPVVGLLAARYEYHHHGDRVDVVLPQPDMSYMVTLAASGAEDGTGASSLPEYAVEEVTIFEGRTGQRKRLSALYTTQAVVDLFAEALITRDRARLNALSTSEFSQRTWSLANDPVLQAVPMPEIEPTPPRVVSTVFQGTMAEVTVMQGSRALTYVLRSSRGRMLVDDVLLPVADRSNSLKSNLEVLIPVYSFALGAHHHDMNLLRQNSAPGLNRMAWTHTQTVPDVGFDLVEYLTLPVQSIRPTSADHTTVELGDGSRRTRVMLVREGPRFVVQDLQLSAGEGPGQQIELLQALRQIVASRNTYAGGAIEVPRGTVDPYETGGGIIPASGAFESPTR